MLTTTMPGSKTTRASGRRLGLAVALLALPLLACDTSDLLEVQEPDIVTPGSLNTPAGRDAMYVGAIGDFMIAYSGGTGGGSYPDNVVTASALLSDETFLSGTFPTRQEFDQRSIALDNGTLRDMFWRLQRARSSLESAAKALEDADAGDARVAELQALAGFTYIAFAENYCNGVPFSTVDPETYGTPQSGADILATAIARFDAALGQSSASDTVRNLALLGKARAQLDNGDYAGAATSAAQVSGDFVYYLYHSINGSVLGFSLDNGMYSAMVSARRSSVANQEGGNGLAFRAMNDLRLQVTKNPAGGFDASTPVKTEGQWNLVSYPLTGEELARTTPFPLASGIEARLIEAEVALQGGDAAGALTMLNALRAGNPDLAPLTDAVDPGARVDQLFTERALWLYVTGHRLSDLRRLVRQYQRNPESVFPTGTYLKGGNFGPDVNFPVPFNETNNPNYKQCTDRAA